MSIKKIACFVLSAAMLTILSSCKTTNETDAGNSDKTKKFSVCLTSMGVEPTEDNKLLKKIKDELGYEFEFEYMISGHEEERTGVMISSREYPDIIQISDETLIQAGALVPLDEYISKEKTPNLYEYFEPIAKKSRYEGDGHIYSFPNYGRPTYGGDDSAEYYGPAFWIQKRVLADAGYPEIKTLDQYFALIEDYKNRHPETNGVSTIGFEILAATGYEWVLTTPPNYLAGNPNDGDVVVDKNTYEAKIYADSDFSKRYFQKLNEEYKKGIIDVECFIQNKDQYLSKISTGRVLGMFDQHWVFQNAEVYLGNQQMYAYQYVPLALTYDESIEPWYRVESQLNINQGFAISKDCEDPEAVIQMFETFMSEKWQKILSWGIEGEDYMVDENGRFYRTEEQRNEQSDQIWSAKNKIEVFYSAMPKREGRFSDGNGTSVSFQPEEYEATLSDYDKKFLQNYGKDNWIQFVNAKRPDPVYFPAWNIELEDGSEASYANQKMTDLARRSLPKVISSDTFDQTWQEYCDELRKINISAYEDKINEQIQWRIKNWQ